MRIPVIAGNWKLFKTTAEARSFANDFIPLVKETSGVEIVLAPVFTTLSSVAALLTGTNIKVSGQDCFWEEEGAYTGEVSPKMLADAGCSHVIIGHSERRQYFGETDATVNKKIKAATSAGLSVLFCIGETLEEREGDLTFSILKKQIQGGLEKITAQQLKNIAIAYEPVWAIGTGKTATESQAEEAHAYIRSVVNDLFGTEVGNSMRILYGGSVKPENICGLMSQPDIDGALVGGASLKADSFASIVNYNRK
jgi:triosephosphate isomerase